MACTVQVYDGTPFLKEHPGGADSILLVAGTDATEEFNAIHSEKAKKQLLQYAIGRLGSSAPPGLVCALPMHILAVACMPILRPQTEEQAGPVRLMPGCGHLLSQDSMAVLHAMAQCKG